MLELDVLVQDRFRELPASKRSEQNGKEGGLIAVGEDISEHLPWKVPRLLER